MWEALATILAGITALIAIFVAVGQAKKASEQNTLAAITKIHDVLSSWRSYETRRYLHDTFPGCLTRVTKEVLGEEFVIRDNGVVARVNVANVLHNLQPDPQKLKALDARLKYEGKATSSEGYQVDALLAVESALLDFDVVALPLHLGIRSAKEIARTYSSIFEITAPIILPFVAIQQQLRGDREYKKHYLGLLKRLNIDLQGLEVPARRASSKSLVSPLR